MSAPTVLPLQPVRMSESFSSLPYPRFQGRGKRGRGKVVSWPPEDQICQVRFFLSNDLPSALGPAQTVFQSHQSRSFSTRNGCLDESLDIPPGFQCSLAKRAKINSVLEVSMSVGTPWVTPRKFIHKSEWLVADGDESKEVALQKQRELRILEAFYPRLTSVPDSSAEPAESSKCLDDNVIPVIPLVSMEDEDENSEGPEHGVKEESDVAVAEHGKLNDEQKPRPQPPTSGCVTPQDASERAVEPTICKEDPKAMAAAAAAAACMAMQKFRASGVVDQELLVEILRNPAFLENLPFLNASRKDLAGPIHGKVGNAGHSNRDPHNINQYGGGPLNKAPFNTGLPSPVSVLSDWTQEHSTNFISRTLSNPSDSSDVSNAKNVSSSMLKSLPFRHSHNAYPLRENPMRMESVSAPLQGVHALMQESGVGMKVLHASNNACAQSASIMHVDRSCGMLAPLAPFPSQNAGNFHSSALGRMQSAHVTPPQACGTYAAGPCRSSFSDARLRGLQNENSGLGSMSKTGLKAARLCMYFNTPRGCRNGGNCAFLHQSLNQELNPIAQ